MRKKVKIFKPVMLLLLAVVLLVGGVAVYKNGYATSADNRVKPVYSTWKPVSWNVPGSIEIDGVDVWSDGVNIYYSSHFFHCVLDVESHTLIPKSWDGLSSFYGEYVWNDGVHVYYSNQKEQYILDVELGKWSPVNWNVVFTADCVFVVNGEYYCKDFVSKYYKLNISNLTWTEVDLSWLRKIGFAPSGFWSDGVNCYYGSSNGHYLLDFDNCSYVEKDTGVDFYIASWKLWKLNGDIFYSYQDRQYVFDTDSQQWKPKVWNTLIVFDGDNVWNDGFNYYYSKDCDQYILVAD